MKARRIYESKEMAIKYYKDKLSPERLQVILDISKGDNYSKMLADMSYLLARDGAFTPKRVYELYQMIKGYDKNIFPIENYNLFMPSVVNNYHIYHALIEREKIVKLFASLPSLIKRNIRDEVRIPRSDKDFYGMADKLQHLIGLISMMDNKSEETRNVILKKAAASKHSIDDMIDFFYEKENLITGRKIDNEYLIKLEDELSSSYIIYNDGGVVVFEVSDPDDMRLVGENSMWCFSYGQQNYRTFNQYTTNGICYVIFNMRINQEDPEFMTTWIRPLPSEDIMADESVIEEIEMSGLPYDLAPIFNAFNEIIEDYQGYLVDTFGSIEKGESICTFE